MHSPRHNGWETERKRHCFCNEALSKQSEEDEPWLILMHMNSNSAITETELGAISAYWNRGVFSIGALIGMRVRTQ